MGFFLPWMLWQSNPPRRDTARRTGLTVIYPIVRHFPLATHSCRSWRWSEHRLLDRANRVAGRANPMKDCAMAGVEAGIRRALFDRPRCTHGRLRESIDGRLECAKYGKELHRFIYRCRNCRVLLRRGGQNNLLEIQTSSRCHLQDKGLLSWNISEYVMLGIIGTLRCH